MSRMQCDQAQSEISALVDGQLSDERQRALREHLSECTNCTALVEDYRRIGLALKGVAYHRAPAGLAERIRLQIKQDGVGERPSFSFAWTRYARYAATLVLVAGLSAVAAWHLAATRSAHVALENELVVAHVRSLLLDNATQVASSDRHTVKPWFIGRLDFSPPVVDLKAEGFPLRGARLDFVGDRRIAAVVYMRRQHVINVFVWPSDSPATLGSAISTVKGYNMVTWTANGILHCAMSDLNIGELKQFQSLMAAQ